MIQMILLMLLSIYLVHVSKRCVVLSARVDRGGTPLLDRWAFRLKRLASLIGPDLYLTIDLHVAVDVSVVVWTTLMLHARVYTSVYLRW